MFIHQNTSYIILKDDFVVIDGVIDKVDLGSQNLTQVVFQLLSHLTKQALLLGRTPTNSKM